MSVDAKEFSLWLDDFETQALDALHESRGKVCKRDGQNTFSCESVVERDGQNTLECSGKFCDTPGLVISDFISGVKRRGTSRQRTAESSRNQTAQGDPASYGKPSRPVVLLTCVHVVDVRIVQMASLSQLQSEVETESESHQTIMEERDQMLERVRTSSTSAKRTQDYVLELKGGCIAYEVYARVPVVWGTHVQYKYKEE